MSILTCHVLSGAVESSSIFGKKLEVESVQESTVSVDGTDAVMVHNASVVTADIKTSNDIIHVIDTVIMP